MEQISPNTQVQNQLESANVTAIAFQGNIGSFSHQAATAFARILGIAQTAFVPCQNFSEIFEKVDAEESAYGAIPLENSSMGTISVNYDLFWLHSAVISQELFLSVHHNLVAPANATLESIREVYSHPAALEQCRKLFKQYPSMKSIPYWDTSASASLVKEKNDPHIAAIASKAAAIEHGLSILLSNIEDYAHNTTRFGLITKHLAENLVLPYKLSLAVELPHEPGSLARFLTTIAKMGVNLTKCESRPIPELPWHYRFFIDMRIADPKQNEAMSELWEAMTPRLKILGRYPAGHNTAET